MSAKIKLELVTPEKSFFSGAADMVVVPGEEGDMGVMHSHMPVISSLKPGIVEIYEGSHVKEKIFISGGFVEITAEVCTILAEEAANTKDVDKKQAEQRLKNASSEKEKDIAEALLNATK